MSGTTSCDRPRTAVAPKLINGLDLLALPASLRCHQGSLNGQRTVVLLHGFPEFSFSWRLQIAPLATAGFRVVALD
jgi:pimeloyl-ACP methyl ester carboxylesterase